MSQYTHIFIRHDISNGETIFVPIIEFSRNTTIAHYLNDYAPYNKIKCIDTYLNNIYDKIVKDAEDIKTRIEKHKKIWSEISQFNNSVEDKLDAINEQLEIIDELNDEQKRNYNASLYIQFLQAMVEENSLVGENIEHKDTIYAGIECGTSVTLEDIQ